MSKNNKKNFYVMDTCINNQNMDQFGHKEIANNIVNLITNDKYSTPYNVALIGKWGLGKSSILKLVANDLEMQKDEYKIISINAWKYERESLKKVFLKNIYEEVSNEKVDYLKQLQDSLAKVFKNQLTSNSDDDGIISTLSKLKPYVLFSLLLSFIWQIFHYIANGGNLSSLFCNNFWYLLSRYFDFYFNKILFTFAVPIFLKFLPDIVSKKSNIFPIQIDYQNDYESLLKNIIKQRKDIKKFIIIIDDLDRLSTKKMVEALDTLKTLMEIDKCIFIVPFDDSILKDALNSQVVSKFDNEHQVIESEFILDKLFQFRFYVPPLINSDMKDYTLEIIRNESNDLYNLFTKDEMDEIVKKIFMYDGLTTPRQIKKIVNTFSNNMLLFIERVNNGKISSDFLNKNGKLMIAKLSVLQSDFNNFYDELFIDNDICEKMLFVNKNSNMSFKDIPKIIQKYFSGNEQNIVIKEQYIKLMNFLSRTSYIKSSDISVYIMSNQDKMSLVYGSKFKSNLLNSMRSMNFNSMNAIIKENRSENLNQLFIDYLESDSSYNLPMIILSILNVNNFEFEDVEFNKKYINFISNVYSSGEVFDLQKINLEQLIKLYKLNISDDCLERLITDYIKYLYNNINDKEIEHEKNYSIIVSHLQDLENIDNKLIKNYLYSLCESDFLYIKYLNDQLLNNVILSNYFGIDTYQLIVDSIKECDDESQKEVYYQLLEKIYNSLKTDSKLLIELNSLIIELLENEDDISYCSDLIVRNTNLFTNDNKIQILNSIKEMTDDTLEEQYMIINALSIDIDSNDEKIQNKIINFIENSYDVSNILDSIRNFELIDNVIEEINKRIYTDSRFDYIYSKNIEKFKNKHFDNLINSLSSTINISTYKEGRLTSIINIISKYINIDKIIVCFTNDELIKNKNSSNEIVHIINNHDDIDLNVINNYIKRVIELLNQNKENITLLKKLKNKMSNDNLKLFVSYITNQEMDKFDLDSLQRIFEILSFFKINDGNKTELSLAFNSLITTSINGQVLDYMIKNNIIIENSIEFIFDNIENINSLKKHKNINEILIINDELISKLIEKLKVKEYSLEQLEFIINLNEKILAKIINYQFEYSLNNINLLLNIQKIINISGNEKKLAEFQIDILNSNNENLICSVITNFLPVVKAENRKIIKENLEKIVNSSQLLNEKIHEFCKKNSYRKIKSKEKVNS